MLSKAQALSRADNERPGRVARSVQVGQHVYNAHIVTVYSLRRCPCCGRGGREERKRRRTNY